MPGRAVTTTCPGTRVVVTGYNKRHEIGRPTRTIFVRVRESGALDRQLPVRQMCTFWSDFLGSGTQVA